MDTMRLVTSLLLVCSLWTVVTSQNDVNQDVTKVSQANSFFAHKLYNQLRKSSPNFVVSPLSLSVALSMVYIGSCGNTLQQLESTLGFSSVQLSDQELLRGYLNLVESLTQCGDGYQFNLANAQFIQDSFPIHDNFTRMITDNFRAELRTVDFSDSENTLNLINGWVRNITRGKIDSILSEVSPDAVMVLSNALYFKGKWLNTFDEEDTRERSFLTESGTRKQVRMMHGDLEVNYNGGHEIGASVLQLPYKGNTFSAVFVLPHEGASLNSLEERLSPEILREISNNLPVQTVTVAIPLLKSESRFDMIDHLEEMGIRELFQRSPCLNGISSVPLEVSKVVHKATLELSEEGCEAAAATAVEIYSRSFVHHERPSFVADRPFMFLVKHNPTNTIVFMGRVADV